MMSEKTYYLTEEGSQKMKLELDQLKTTGRDELARRLRDAIQMGDLSENADYHKAKEDQAFLEGRIQELQFLLSNAVIVDTSRQQRDVIDVGAVVTVQEEDSEPETYFLVGIKEADPRNGRISNESPIGRALLGKKVGETALAQTPSGQIKLRILEIK